jgi:isopentenyldiphosphate isomerase
MELFEVFDKAGNPTGEILERGYIHSRGLWHRTVHVWIHREPSEILLQKRAPGKDSHPGCWDVSAAGHVEAGETPLQSAVREMREELGLEVVPEDLRFVDRTRRTLISEEGAFIDREHTFVYLYGYTGIETGLSPDPGEVAELRFVETAQLRSMVENEAEHAGLVPYGARYYLGIIDLVEKRGQAHADRFRPEWGRPS